MVYNIFKQSRKLILRYGSFEIFINQFLAPYDWDWAIKSQFRRNSIYCANLNGTCDEEHKKLTQTSKQPMWKCYQEPLSDSLHLFMTASFALSCDWDFDLVEHMVIKFKAFWCVKKREIWLIKVHRNSGMKRKKNGSLFGVRIDYGFL